MPNSATIRITRYHDRAILPQVETGVDNLAGNIVVRMRRLVPKRSFRLYDSIEKLPTTVTGSKVKGGVRVGGKSVRGKYVGYHLMVDKGTSRMAAQPYIRPALYQSRSGDLRVKVSE